jgi:hypothetical protein
VRRVAVLQPGKLGFLGCPVLLLAKDVQGDHSPAAVRRFVLGREQLVAARLEGVAERIPGPPYG